MHPVERMMEAWHLVFGVVAILWVFGQSFIHQLKKNRLLLG